MAKAYVSRYVLPSALDIRPPSTVSRNALDMLKVEGGGLRVKYIGPGETDAQAASIRANACCPPDCPLFYYEVEIISMGRYGYIGIGFTAEDVFLNRLPGWEKRSYGYHGDDGCAFSGQGHGKAYGPHYTTGDIVGVLLNRIDRTITYFKNGMDLGVAFTNVCEDKLFPVVGLRTQGEELNLNFGSSPFVTDLQALRTAQQHAVHSRVTQHQLPSTSTSGTALLPQLIYDYLLHHRCSKTASVFAHAAFGPDHPHNQSTTDDIHARSEVHALVLAGNVDAALRKLNSTYTIALLEAHPGVHFKLQLQKFLELVRCGPSHIDAALSFGRGVLASLPHGPEEMELFVDALSLLAYDAPEASPAGHLLAPSQRQAVADAVNGAVLQHLGRPATAPLDGLVRQAVTVMDELHVINHPEALQLNVKQILTPDMPSG